MTTKYTPGFLFNMPIGKSNINKSTDYKSSEYYINKMPKYKLKTNKFRINKMPKYSVGNK